jgi:hypothetical protein
MSNASRKARGRRTELVLVERLRTLFPNAAQVNSAASGADILNTPGLAIEVKARRGLDLPAWMRQAAKNAKPGEMPVLITRLNGQGEEWVEDWPVILGFGDFLRTVSLLKQATDEIIAINDMVFKKGICPYSWEELENRPGGSWACGVCDCGRDL